MRGEIPHSFNVRLAEKVAEKIRKLQERLREEFRELRAYDTGPHLSLLTKFMRIEETDAFARALQHEFRFDGRMEVTFSGIYPSKRGNYLFLYLTPDSEALLKALHCRALDATAGIGVLRQTDRPDRPRYEYHPHVSIIKMDASQVRDAEQVVFQKEGEEPEERGFTGLVMPVQFLELVRQEDDEQGFPRFPVVQAMELP